MTDIPLLAGWFPVATACVVAGLALLVLVRGGQRWWTLSVPVALVAGVAAGWGCRRLLDSMRLAPEEPPRMLLVWVGVAAAALVALLLGWRSARAWRRVVSLILVPAAVFAAAVSVNEWTGYFRSVEDVWETASGEGLPDSVALADLPGLRGSVPTRGRVVSFDIPVGQSGFVHRTEYAYLPPAWFAGPTPPALPVVEMMGGAFATPLDWARTGDADRTVDAYAAAHGGVAPILVFADAGGDFTTDTECVDGALGNSATHLEKEVPEFVEKTFGTATDPAQWAVMGWSMGGTCAIQMAARHPETYRTFIDIAGDTGPNIGSPDHTLATLYGGDRQKMSEFDPWTQLGLHAPYSGTVGLFEEGANGKGAGVYDASPTGAPSAMTPAGAADVLAPKAAASGIPSHVIRRDLQHTWQFAHVAFEQALPWLAGRLGTPGSPELPISTTGS